MREVTILNRDHVQYCSSGQWELTVPWSYPCRRGRAGANTVCRGKESIQISFIDDSARLRRRTTNESWFGGSGQCQVEVEFSRAFRGLLGIYRDPRVVAVYYINHTEFRNTYLYL